MSDKKDTTHVLIDKQLVIFLRPRSAVWQCRYQVDKRWQRESTGEHELDKAKKRAHDLLIEANVRKKLNVAPITRYFKDIAKLAVQRMDEELQADNGKVIYKDYKSVIEKYLVPFFGKYKVDSIDYKVLELFNDWRTKRMGAAPKHSTLLNHNAALNRIFDEAEKRNFLLPISRPKLNAKGKKSERRIEFNLEETRALVRNFDGWISKGRADSVAVRALLKDYVITLLDTGARPGRELLCLTWAQVQQKFYPNITKTGVQYDDGEGNVEEIETVNANRTVFLNIQQSKTDKRIAVGRLPTALALRAIAKRNYDKSLEDLLKVSNTDAIFRFKEYLNDEEIANNKQPKLLTPTSFAKLFALATALAEGRVYAPSKTKVVIDEGSGEKRSVEAAKRLKQWWWNLDGGKLALTVRYGAKVLAIGSKDKNAIEIASASELVKVFELVKTAAAAGELDDAIAAASAKLRSGFGK